jgi:hypothetical protein
VLVDKVPIQEVDQAMPGACKALCGIRLRNGHVDAGNTGQLHEHLKSGRCHVIDSTLEFRHETLGAGLGVHNSLGVGDWCFRRIYGPPKPARSTTRR